MFSVGIWMGSFRCTGIFLLQWQVENSCASTTFESLPLSTCTLCQQKSYNSKCIEPIFEIFGSARRCSVCAFELEASGAQVFFFWQWQGENFAHRQYLNFCHIQPVHCASKNPISPKVFIPIFEIFSLNSKMFSVGHLGGNVSGTQVFYFCNGKVKTWRIEQHLKFCHVQPVHCASKNPISPKVFNRFSKSLPQLEDVQVGHLGGKFQVRR